ncbi:MAG: TatD family hydrolase [Candidatus Nitrosotenuis sp.]
MNRFVDTHCHLNFVDAFSDVRSTLLRAQSNGVDRLIVIGCDGETSARAVELAESYEGVYACVGWHPNYASSYDSVGLQTIRRLAESNRVVGIGEIGLDRYWDYATPEEQAICLEAQLGLASELDLPVVFHCRDAYIELLDWIERAGRLWKPFVLHCFSGVVADAERALGLGCYLGVGGPITYKKAAVLREAVRLAPSNRLLLETDSPYLSPHPYRGKPNEPALIPVIASGLAEALGLEVSAVAEFTTLNAESVFGLK